MNLWNGKREIHSEVENWLTKSFLGWVWMRLTNSIGHHDSLKPFGFDRYDKWTFANLAFCLFLESRNVRMIFSPLFSYLICKLNRLRWQTLIGCTVYPQESNKLKNMWSEVYMCHRAWNASSIKKKSQISVFAIQMLKKTNQCFANTIFGCSNCQQMWK